MREREREGGGGGLRRMAGELKLYWWILKPFAEIKSSESVWSKSCAVMFELCLFLKVVTCIYRNIMHRFMLLMTVESVNRLYHTHFNVGNFEFQRR
jgi:hypothetical protein